MAAIVGAAAARGLGSAQRDVKPDHESLARTGEAMTTAAMAAYALQQIDEARSELERKTTSDKS
jgi:hypothetical protein